MWRVGKRWGLLAKCIITFRFLHISFIACVIYSSWTASFSLKVLPAFLELDWTNILPSVCLDTCEMTFKVETNWSYLVNIFKMIMIISTDQIKLTIVDSLHKVTPTSSITVWHSNCFLFRGLPLSARFPDMFWYQWTINAKVKKKDQVKLSSDWMYPRCPHILIMLVPVQQLIPGWLSTSVPDGLHHFRQRNLPVFSLVSCMQAVAGNQSSAI